MSRLRVDGKVVESVDTLRSRNWSSRLDIWPIAISYCAWLAAVLSGINTLEAFIILGCLFAFHILLLLFTVWSVDFKCLVQHSKVDDIYAADTCKVTPVKFYGSKEVVPLHFRKLACMEDIYFDFRKQRFIYSKEKNSFTKLPYPSKETMGYYLKNTGYGTEAEVVGATEKWGRNV